MNFASHMTLGEFCEANGLSQAEVPVVFQMCQQMEAERLARLNAQLNSVSQTFINEVRPDEGIGSVKTRTPMELHFHLLKQKNFGPEGLRSEDGIKDLLKAYPMCRVKEVSGKIQSGFTGRRTVKRYPDQGKS